MDNQCETSARKHRRPLRASVATTAVLICCLYFTGCSRAPVDDVDASNARVAGAVKVALVETTELRAAPIDVVADNGVVTLSGFVDSERHRQSAQDIASTVRGVVKVTNRLQVK